MAVIPPLMLYEDYWPEIRDTMPDVAQILAMIQKLVVIGEKRRVELIKKRNLIDRLNIQLQALNDKLNDIERAIEADAEIVDMWCIDYTLEIPVGTTIGTMETPGEATRLNIQRGYEEDDDTGFAMSLYNDARDGMIQPIYPVSFLSGASWFFNAAMKAAWQKWMPLFRYGTITEMIDQEDGTRKCNILLDASTEASTILSGAHGLLSTGDVHYIAGPTGLNINQTDELHDVPFQYMDCDDVAFAVDDEVVIEFRELQLPIWTKGEVDTQVVESGEFVSQSIMTMKEGWVQSGTGPARDWSQPVVIGFQHDPQPCAWIFRIRVTMDNNSVNGKYEDTLVIDSDFFDEYNENLPEDEHITEPRVYIFEATGYYGTGTPSTCEFIESSSSMPAHWKITIPSEATVINTFTKLDGERLFGELWEIPEGAHVLVDGVPYCSLQVLFDYCILFDLVYNYVGYPDNQGRLLKTAGEGYAPDSGWKYSPPMHLGEKTAIFDYTHDKTVHDVLIPGDYHYSFRIYIDNRDGGTLWKDVTEGVLETMKLYVHFRDQDGEMRCNERTISKSSLDDEGYLDLTFGGRIYDTETHKYHYLPRPPEFEGLWFKLTSGTSTWSWKLDMGYYPLQGSYAWYAYVIPTQYPYVYVEDEQRQDENKTLPCKADFHVAYWMFRKTVGDNQDKPSGEDWCCSPGGSFVCHYLFGDSALEGREIYTSVSFKTQTSIYAGFTTGLIVKYHSTSSTVDPPPLEERDTDVTYNLGGGSCPDGDYGDPYCIPARISGGGLMLITYEPHTGLCASTYTSEDDPYSKDTISGWHVDDFPISEQHNLHRILLEGRGNPVGIGGSNESSCTAYYYLWYGQAEGGVVSRWWTSAKIVDYLYPLVAIHREAITYEMNPNTGNPPPYIP